MKFSSFFRFFGERRPRLRAKGQQRRYCLEMETLEARITPVVPSVVSVTPLDGSVSLSALPTLQVIFNEDVRDSSGGLLQASDFSLFGSSGNSIPVNSVNYALNASNQGVATLTYNGGANLVVDTYTLFVRADHVVDNTGSGLHMGQPGQLAVVSNGQNNVSLIGMPGTGTLGTLADYPMPANAGVQATPSAVLLANLTGAVDANNNPIPDLVVIDSTTDSVNVFQGRVGGGFDLTPDVVLDLPTGAGAKAVAAGDLNNDGAPDLIVANTALSSVSVFLNTRTSTGQLAFGSATTTALPAAGELPIGLAIGDFNTDGNQDVAVLNSAAPADVDMPADMVDDYTIDILPGTGTGTFGATVPVKIGDVTPTGLTAPTGIAVGLFNADTKPDLAVSGTQGLLVLTNTSTNNITFNQNLIPTTTALTAVAAGQVHIPQGANNRNDIVATTAGGGGQVLVFVNDNTGNFTIVGGLPISSGAVTPTAVAITDLDNNGYADIVTNDTTTSAVNVINNFAAGLISNATNAGPIVITSNNNGLQTGAQITITGVQGNTAANGNWTVTRINANQFSLNGSAGNGMFMPGGALWYVTSVANGSGNVMGTTGNAVSPIVITSDVPTGLVTGQQVTVANVGGNMAANGTWTVTVIDATHFSLNGSTGNGTWTMGTGSWSRLPYRTDAGPVSLAVGDTNQDGDVDVVTANSTGRDVSVFSGLGNGALGVAANYSLANNSQPDAVASGDLNKDGIPDLVVANYNLNTVTVFLGLSGGGYAPGVTYSTVVNGKGRNPNSVTLADLTGTGKLDILTTSGTDSVVTILPGMGNGTFGPGSTVAVGTNPDALAVGDFNNDGKLDLAVAHLGGGGGGFGHGGGGGGNSGVTVLIGNGDRTFKKGVEYEAPTGGGFGGGGGTSIAPTAIAVGDFNKDGNLDIVIADSNSHQVILRQGDGTGNFPATGRFVFPVGVNPDGLIVADLNRDGFPDVITISSSSTTADSISVLLNSQGSGFSPYISTTLGVGAALQSVTVANVNQDAYPDLVVTVKGVAIAPVGGGFGGGGGGPAVTNASPIVISSANHGLATGQVVTITGVLGNTAANGTWTITVVDQNHFSLNGSTGNGAYTSGGSWTPTAAAAFDNVFTLLNNGDGSFQAATPYLAAKTGNPTPGASYVAVVSDPWQRVVTFTSGGTTVNANLVSNGGFEVRDLTGAGQPGRLDLLQPARHARQPRQLGRPDRHHQPNQLRRRAAAAAGQLLRHARRGRRAAHPASNGHGRHGRRWHPGQPQRRHHLRGQPRALPGLHHPHQRHQADGVVQPVHRQHQRWRHRLQRHPGRHPGPGLPHRQRRPAGARGPGESQRPHPGGQRRRRQRQPGRLPEPLHHPTRRVGHAVDLHDHRPVLEPRLLGRQDRPHPYRRDQQQRQADPRRGQRQGAGHLHRQPGAEHQQPAAAQPQLPDYAHHQRGDHRPDDRRHRQRQRRRQQRLLRRV